MKNYSVTIERRPSDTSSTILTSTYTEEYRRVERLEWQPHHIVFYTAHGQVAAIRADRVIELVSFEE